jgi:hypothetical protein
VARERPSTGQLPEATSAYLASVKASATTAHLFGGVSALSAGVLTAASDALGAS